LESIAVRPAVPTFASTRSIFVILETPKATRNKVKFDEQLQHFRLGKVLPAGAVFPFDFGFIPGTRAEDGEVIDCDN
jgi:inorganic pyrophosphatase